MCCEFTIFQLCARVQTKAVAEAQVHSPSSTSRWKGPSSRFWLIMYVKLFQCFGLKNRSFLTTQRSPTNDPLTVAFGLVLVLVRWVVVLFVVCFFSSFICETCFFWSTHCWKWSVYIKDANNPIKRFTWRLSILHNDKIVRFFPSLFRYDDANPKPTTANATNNKIIWSLTYST